MFSYQEGDKGSTDSGNNKHLAKIFKQGDKGLDFKKNTHISLPFTLIPVVGF